MGQYEVEVQRPQGRPKKKGNPKRTTVYIGEAELDWLRTGDGISRNIERLVRREIKKEKG